MDRTGNHIGHADSPHGSPRKLSKKKYRNLAEVTDYTSDYTGTSTKTPSIVGLENLRMFPADNFSVPTIHDSKFEKPHRRKALDIFKPGLDAHEGRKLTQVFIKVVILKVGEIETIKEFFEADVFIQARWREPVLDSTETKVTDFSQFWGPELVIQNVFEDPKETIWHQVHYNKLGQAFIYEMRRIKGKFYETMELNHFPFDVQPISLVISSDLSKDIVEILEDTTELSTIHVDCFSDSQEWTLHNFVELSPLDISARYTRVKRTYPGLIVTCCVTRRSGFFAWNVLVIVNLLNIFAFTTFAVDPSLTQNRLQLSFILLLSGISFRFVTNQSIPKISYLTHLDRYVLISMIFSGLITFWHAVLSRFHYNADLQARMDFGVFVSFAVIYVVFQVIFITVILYQRSQKLEEIRLKEDQYRVHAKSIMGDVWDTIRSEIRSVSWLGHHLRKRNHVATRR